MLRVYTSSDFKQLQSWVTDCDILLQFSGTDFSFPLEETQLLGYQELYPDRTFYLGYLPDNTPYAFGEIIPQEGNIPRLGRILVGRSELRGQKLGRCFVRMLLEQCRLLYDCEHVELLVWNENFAAIKCYQSVGFVYCSDKLKTLVVGDRSLNIHKMIYSYDSFLPNKNDPTL